MKKSTKIISLLVCIAMLISMLPVSAFAATEQTDYLFLATDRHGSETIIGQLLQQVEDSIGDGALDYVGLGGDMVNDTDAYNSSTVLGEVQSVADHMTDANVDLLYAAHDEKCTDDAEIMNYSSGLWMTLDNSYVYGVVQSDMQNASSAATAAAAFTSWASGLTDDKAIIVLSHMPLHQRRNDNNGASYWAEALNTVAAGDDSTIDRNVAFFWGHNHTGESSADTAVYFVTPGSSISVQGRSSSQTVYFTYANAGYLNQNKEASLVTITDSTITFKKVSTSGLTELGSVARVVTEEETVTLESITVTGTTEYTVGDELDLTVTAVFSDGSTADVTEDAALSGADMQTAGTYTVTASYEDKTATIDITVTAAETETTTPTVGNGTNGTDDTDGSNETTENSYQNVTTGGTTTEEVTIYKLVSSITSGNEYLIVNTNSATTSGHALGHSGSTIADDAVTVNAADSTSSVVYIKAEDVDDTSVWTAGNSYTFKNGNYYVAYRNRSLTASTSSFSWSYSNNRLSCTSGRSTYYIQYNNSWSASNSSSNVYLYEKTTAEVTTTTEVTYSMSASDLTAVVDSTHLTGKLNYELLGNGESLTTLPEGGSYSCEVKSDDNGIISAIDADGNITFTGAIGEAAVKIAYTWTVDGTEYVVYKYITVTTSAPYYTVEITEGEAIVDNIVADGHVISLKGDNHSVTLGAIVYYHGPEGTVEVEDAEVSWYIDSSAATVTDGVVVFTKDGSATVTASYQADGDTYVIDDVELHYTTSAYTVPEDGTNDFPEYPNEGAIRFDKTATGVEWADSAVTKVELSLTGVPYTEGSEIDVVLMLDMTGSMSDDDMVAAEEAAIVFAQQLVVNEDGTYNDNRVAVLAFNSNASSPFTLWSLGVVTADTWDSFCTAVRTASTKQSSGGTPYSDALSECRDILTAAKIDGTGNDRLQFCVFMSDGGPTSYTYITNYDEVKAGTATAYQTSTASASGGANQSDSNFATIAGYTHENYSTLMKDEGVVMYTVGTGMTASDNPNGATILANIASSADKSFLVASSSDTSGLNSVFTNIAVEIKQAATEAQVKDGISDYYDLYAGGETADDEFGIDGSTAGQYPIIISEWTLDENHQRSTETVLATVVLTMSESDNADEATVTGATITYTDGSTATVSVLNGFLNIPTRDGSGLLVSYNVANKEFTWEVDTVRSTELVLSYYVILKEEYRDIAATYPTNSYATLSYLNYRDVECQVEFPVPQMTWLGAQVSYVFYLVNSEGQPVNHAGKVVPIGEAIYVSDVFTYSHLWSDEVATLEADYLAQDLLPDVYELYDSAASYTIHAYRTAENGTDMFKIGGSADKDIDEESGTTTYVFNNKSDATKYNIRDVEYTKTNATDIDFHNTTVAFAVVWTPSLNPDTVVIDFGLSVNVNVTANDYLNATVAGVSATALNADINSGLLLDEPDYSSSVTTAHGAFKVGGENIVTYTPGDMNMTEPESIYYIAEATFYVYNTVQTGYMYSSLTVIPATTIYYEDSFVDLSSYSAGEDGTFTEDETPAWAQEVTTGTQDTDRPGENQIGTMLDDADNNYGYDSAYTNMTTYSLDSAASINVNSSKYGKATFTFTGTGFDVISLTSNTTGNIFVDVVDAEGVSAGNFVVDTYYGYAYQNGQWVTVDSADPNALYQVPVMKVTGLDYGTYTVTIHVSYNSIFDHTGTGSYNFYLDAIRIYDPTGNQNSTANDAYVADGEGWPSYTELRNNLIDAATLSGSESVKGAVFIDGIGETAVLADYVSYGPNNEVYLANGQAIAFNYTTDSVADLQLGIKSADGNPVTYKINDDSYTVSTATDMYYSILDYAQAGSTVVIQNVSGGILSLTTLKATFTADPNGVSAASLIWMDEASAEATLMCLSLDYEEPETPTEPDVTEPDPTEPDATEPEATEPDATEPEETEPEAFQPEKLQVQTSSSSIKVGSTVLLTVTTSKDVASVLVNGVEVENSMDTRNSRIWTVRVTAETVGDMILEVVACNEAGVASEPVAKTVTVTENYTSIGNIIGDIIGGFLGKWF